MPASSCLKNTCAEVHFASRIFFAHAPISASLYSALRSRKYPCFDVFSNGAMRRSVSYAAGHSVADSLELERQMMNATGATEDHAAAVAAFVAKQKPEFHGR